MARGTDSATNPARVVAAQRWSRGHLHGAASYGDSTLFTQRTNSGWTSSVDTPRGGDRHEERVESFGAGTFKTRTRAEIAGEALAKRVSRGTADRYSQGVSSVPWG